MAKLSDTKAINQMIDETAAKGGGTVYFPAGIYLTFSIRLKSNITLCRISEFIIMVSEFIIMGAEQKRMQRAKFPKMRKVILNRVCSG